MATRTVIPKKLTRLRDLIRAVAQTHGKPCAVDILSRVANGAQNVSQLDPSQYDAVIAECRRHLPRPSKLDRALARLLKAQDALDAVNARGRYRGVEGDRSGRATDLYEAVDNVVAVLRGAR